MRKFLIAAAVGFTVVVAGLLNIPRAEAMPLALPLGITDRLNMVDKIAVCFYFDGWNGPGLYECGYRHRRGEGWHGRRDDRRRDLRHDNHRRNERRDDRRRDRR